MLRVSQNRVMSSLPDAPEITPEELVRAIESGHPLRVLDVRAPAALAGGKIDVVPPEKFINIRGSEILSMGEGVATALPADGPIAVVCGKGNSSRQIVHHLIELGYSARSLRGGMAAWGDAVVSRELQPPAGFDVWIQFRPNREGWARLSRRFGGQGARGGPAAEVAGVRRSRA
jgi:rhodanese-related sulfurtransferase